MIYSPSFQTCLTYFLLHITKGDILRDVDNQTTLNYIDFQCMNTKLKISSFGCH